MMILRKPLTSDQKAQLDRFYLTSFKGRIKAGENAPFASLMAGIEKQQELNRISPVI